MSKIWLTFVVLKVEVKLKSIISDTPIYENVKKMLNPKKSIATSSKIHIFAPSFNSCIMEQVKDNFVLTWKYLKAKHEYFNEHLFNGRLKWCSLLTSNTEHLGDFCYRDGYPQIRISVKYLRTEEAYCNTLLHEMIHQYIFQFGIEDTRTHGKEFKRISADINRYGYNTEDESVIGLNMSVKQRKTATDYVVCSYLQKSGSYFVFRIAESRVNYYISWFESRADYFRNPVIVKTDNPIFKRLHKNVKSVKYGFEYKTQNEVNKVLAKPKRLIYRAITLSCENKQAG